MSFKSAHMRYVSYLRVSKCAVLGYYTSIIGVGSTPEDVQYSAPAALGLAGENIAREVDITVPWNGHLNMKMELS